VGDSKVAAPLSYAVFFCSAVAEISKTGDSVRIPGLGRGWIEWQSYLSSYGYHTVIAVNCSKAMTATDLIICEDPQHVGVHRDRPPGRWSAHRNCST